MTTELWYLAAVALLTAVLWVPYTVNLIAVRGLRDAVGYPENPAPLASWAQRLKKAHYNAVENLVVFAPLVLVAHLVEASGEATALACQVYFWARVVHALAYTFAVPLVRTLAFVTGWGAIVALAWQILG
ncbi:MAG TPA: MAPEG family protein [Thermoanaerobaculia bacterium]|nr:MAPEG family protein [Thermoanaerobaculia bacterium]